MMRRVPKNGVGGRERGTLKVNKKLTISVKRVRLSALECVPLPARASDIHRLSAVIGQREYL
jgi:hypothetical protein